MLVPWRVRLCTSTIAGFFFPNPNWAKVFGTINEKQPSLPQGGPHNSRPYRLVPETPPVVTYGHRWQKV